MIIPNGDWLIRVIEVKQFPEDYRKDFTKPWCTCSPDGVLTEYETEAEAKLAQELGGYKLLSYELEHLDER